jgi:hypothetical protein
MGRFTLDAATDFMFGSCVNSLSAQLPYAYNSPHRNGMSQPHPSDSFAAAFSQAQEQVALRNWLTDAWPLAEFWKDKTKEPMRVIHDYIDPILRDALTKRIMTEKESPMSVDGGEGGTTLLDHLATQTNGEQCSGVEF